MSRRVFNIINSNARKLYDLTFTEEHEELTDVDKSRIGFYFLAISTILGINDEEIKDIITDTDYRKKIDSNGEDDYGIDGIHIDEEKKIISIFAFKYRENYNEDKTQSNEMLNKLDRGLMYIKNENKYSEESLGRGLTKIEEKINKLIDIYCTSTQIWDTNIYLISNEKKLPQSAYEYVKNKTEELDFVYTSYGRTELYKQLTETSEVVNGSIIIDNDSFLIGSIEGTSNSYYMAEIEAVDFLRLCMSSEVDRLNSEIQDIEELLVRNREKQFFEAILDENVRGYLGISKSKFNDKILKTLTDEPENFILYNNGITVLCDNITHDKINAKKKSQINFFNMKIVNGGQTIKTIHKYYSDSSIPMDTLLDKLSHVKLQVKFNKIDKDRIKYKISEYTNSQNSISSRDLHSNDVIQRDIENYLKTYGIFYQRKSGIYDFANEYRFKIDAFELAQIIHAFNGYPYQSVNLKQRLFDSKYSEIFNDDLNLSDVLNISELYEEVKKQKFDNKIPTIQERCYIIYFKLMHGLNEELIINTFRSERSNFIVEKQVDRPQNKLEFFEHLKICLGVE